MCFNRLPFLPFETSQYEAAVGALRLPGFSESTAFWTDVLALGLRKLDI
jgi:hypothetical protein